MVGQEMLIFSLQIWYRQSFWGHNMCTWKTPHYPVRQTVLLHHKTSRPARHSLPGLANPLTTSFLGSHTFWLSGSQCLIHPVLTKDVSVNNPIDPHSTTNRKKKIDQQRAVSGLNLWDFLNAYNYWGRVKSKHKRFQCVIQKKPPAFFIFSNY